MKKECNGYKLSACCGSTLLWGDTCANCGKYSPCQCTLCPQEDIDTCEELGGFVVADYAKENPKGCLLWSLAGIGVSAVFWFVIIKMIFG